MTTPPSTTAVNPICTKCGTEIIVDDGGMVMSGKRFYHNTCAPDYAASPSPEPDSQPDIAMDAIKAVHSSGENSYRRGGRRDDVLIARSAFEMVRSALTQEAKPDSQPEDVVARAKTLVANMRKTYPERGPTADTIDELCATINRLAKERDLAIAQFDARADAMYEAEARAEAAEQALVAANAELASHRSDWAYQAEISRRERAEQALADRDKEIERLRNLLMKAKGH